MKREPTGMLREDATSRRDFLKFGAAGAATAAFGGSLLRLTSAQATLPVAKELDLFISEGDVRMVDGTPVFMRAFGRSPEFSPPDEKTPFRAREGDLINVHLTNTLAEPHSFSITDVVESGPVEPGATVDFTIECPEAGTYMFASDDPIQRTLGLEGILILDPIDGSNRPYIDGPEYVPPDFVWNFHDIDPVWGEQARRGEEIDPSTFMPRYFTINGKSGLDSISNPATVFHRHIGEAVLLRLVNTGFATHMPHWHGNHVEILSENGRRLEFVVRKDVVRMDGLDRKDVFLPIEPPGDMFPPPDPTTSHVFQYPMHCHAEMSQTAGGGNYPAGMLADWEIEIDAHE